MKTYNGEGGVFYNYATDEIFTLKRLGTALGMEKEAGHKIYVFEDEVGELIGGFLLVPTAIQLDGPEGISPNTIWVGK